GDERLADLKSGKWENYSAGADRRFTEGGWLLQRADHVKVGGRHPLEERAPHTHEFIAAHPDVQTPVIERVLRDGKVRRPAFGSGDPAGDKGRDVAQQKTIAQD